MPKNSFTLTFLPFPDRTQSCLRVPAFKCQKTVWEGQLRTNTVYLQKEACTALSLPPLLLSAVCEVRNSVALWAITQQYQIKAPPCSLKRVFISFNFPLHCNASSFPFFLHVPLMLNVSVADRISCSPWFPGKKLSKILSSDKPDSTHCHRADGWQKLWGEVSCIMWGSNFSSELCL